MPTYHIAIIGAGPAGLSAGARAAERDRLARRPQPTHVLLEGSPALAQTIQRYQKGKHVMAEPGYLDLRSPVRFGPGSREQVLAGWTEDIARLGVNVRYGAEVRKVSGAKGAFTIALGAVTNVDPQAGDVLGPARQHLFPAAGPEPDRAAQIEVAGSAITCLPF